MTETVGAGWRDLRVVLLDLDETLIPDESAVNAAIEAAWDAVMPAEPSEGTAKLVRGVAREIWRAGPHWPLTRGIGISSWEPLWAAFRTPVPGLPELGSWVEGYRREVWRTALDRRALAPGLANELSRRFQDQRRLRCVAFEGVEATLRELRRRYRLAVVTNGMPELQREKASLAGIDRLVDVIVVSGDVGRAKPDPAPCVAALDQLGVAPEEAVMVGDSLEKDVPAGAAAGMHTIWIAAEGDSCQGSVQPTATLHSIRDLPVFLETAVANAEQAPANK